MIIDRLKQDASFMRVLTRAGGWHKAYLIDEMEVQKISATMIEAAERIEALERAGGQKMTEREQLESAIREAFQIGKASANEHIAFSSTAIALEALIQRTAKQARATPALPQGEHDLEDVRCQCCGYMTYHSEHMGCIRSAYKQALPQVPECMAIVPVEGFKIEAGSDAYQEIIVTAADGGQQIFWPEDAAYGLMKAMLAAREKGE